MNTNLEELCVKINEAKRHFNSSKAKIDGFEFNAIDRLVEFLKLYPVDLMVGIMKDIKNSYDDIYKLAIENEKFVDLYFGAYSSIRG